MAWDAGLLGNRGNDLIRKRAFNVARVNGGHQIEIGLASLNRIIGKGCCGHRRRVQLLERSTRIGAAIDVVTGDSVGACVPTQADSV